MTFDLLPETPPFTGLFLAHLLALLRALALFLALLGLFHFALLLHR